MEQKKFYKKGGFWILVLIVVGIVMVLLEHVFMIPKAVSNHSSWSGYGFLVFGVIFFIIWIRSHANNFKDSLKIVGDLFG